MPGLKSLRRVSDEEVQRRTLAAFALIRPGALFDISGVKFYLAARQIDAEAWEVIELTGSNVRCVIDGTPAKRSTLRLEQVKTCILNLHNPDPSWVRTQDYPTFCAR